MGEPRAHSWALSWLGMANIPRGGSELRVEADSILMSSWGLVERGPTLRPTVFTQKEEA